MHIPKQKKAFFMPMFSHAGERSLDAIATRDRRPQGEARYLARAAPGPDYILADLITKGELPYGTYVLSVWW